MVFDFFFPGLLPGSATTVPPELIANYDTVYVPKIKAAIAAHPQRARQVLAVTKAPGGPGGANIEETFVSVLWYAVFATNDASQQLGGQPFDNRQRWYRGSSVDLLLNLFVERADADSQALLEIEAGYQSSGLLARPLVTMHTTGDQIIPYWHEPLYTAKVMAMGSDALHDNIPVLRYGHCNFTASDVVVGFLLLLQRAGGQPVAQEAIDALPAELRAR